MAGQRVVELGAGTHEVRVVAIETAHDEDLTGRKRDGRGVRARRREFTRGKPADVQRHSRVRARGDDERAEEHESDRRGTEFAKTSHAASPDRLAYCALSVTPWVDTSWSLNQLTPSCTRSNETV